MAKTKEELETLKKECSELSKKMKDLTQMYKERFNIELVLG